MKEAAEKYRQATEELLTLAQSISTTGLDRRDEDGWSPRQVIHHLADSEAQSYARLRRLIAEPGTMIQGYDESIWAENSTLGYKSEPIESALEVFAAVRKASYELILRLTTTDLERFGEHSESGRYSINDWLTNYINHPIDHANQMRKQLRG